MIGMGDMQLESSTTSDVCGRVDVQEPRGSKKANGNLQNASPAFPEPTAQPARHTENRTPSMPQTLSGILRRTVAEPEAPTALEALAALELRIMQPPGGALMREPGVFAIPARGRDRRGGRRSSARASASSAMSRRVGACWLRSRRWRPSLLVRGGPPLSSKIAFARSSHTAAGWVVTMESRTTMPLADTLPVAEGGDARSSSGSTSLTAGPR